TVIFRRRGKAAATDRRCDGEPELRALQFDRAVQLRACALLLRDEARSLVIQHAVGRVVHFERRKDVLAEIILEYLARYDLDQPADHIGARAVVPAFAGIEQQRPAEWETIAGVRREIAPDRAGEGIGQSGRVRQEMPDGCRSGWRPQAIVAGRGVEGFDDL